MIHSAIYDCHPVRGQELGEFSKGFPGEYGKSLMSVSTCFGDLPEEVPASRVPAIRYSPVNDKYLLSVMTRLYDGRWYNRIVHFLMDREDADKLLGQDWSRLSLSLASMHRQDAQAQSERLASILETPGVKAGELTEPPVQACRALVAGAMLTRPEEKVRFVVDEHTPAVCLNWLMAQLPGQLRRNVSFNTNVTVPSEGKGVCMVFCNAEAERYMAQIGNAGGELADVSVCHVPGELFQHREMKEQFLKADRLLTAPRRSRQIALELLRDRGDWDTLLEVSCVEHQDPVKALQQLVGLLPADTVADAVRRELYPPQTLQPLCRRAPEWLRGAPEVHQAVNGLCRGTQRPAEKLHARQDASPAPRKKGSGIPVLLALLAVILAAAVYVGLGCFEISDAGGVVVITRAAVGCGIRYVLGVLLGALGGFVLYCIACRIPGSRQGK